MPLLTSAGGLCQAITDDHECQEKAFLIFSNTVVCRN